MVASLNVHRTHLGYLDTKFQKVSPCLRGATPRTAYPVKSVCTLTCVYLSKQARAMVHLAEVREKRDVEMIVQISTRRNSPERKRTWKDMLLTGANNSPRYRVRRTELHS